MKHPSLEQCILQMALIIALHPESSMPHKHIPTRNAQYQTKLDRLLITQLPGLCYLLHMLSTPKLPETFTENQLDQLEDIVPGISRNLDRIGCSSYEVSNNELLDLIADLKPSAERDKQKTAAVGVRLLAANPCIAIRIATLDGLPPLQLLAQTPITPASLQAAMAVSLIIASINERVAQCMRACDELSLDMVIAAARLGDKEERIAAAAVLERLASSEIYRRRILKLGGLDVLAQLLRSPSPTLRSAALKAIAETAQSQAAALKLSALGIRPILMGVVEASLLTAPELAAELGADLEENQLASSSLQLRWCAWSSALLALWRLAMAEHWQSSASTADSPFDLAAFAIFACATFFERPEAKTDPMRCLLQSQQVASASSAPGGHHHPSIAPSLGGDMAGSMSEGCQLLLQMLAAESTQGVRMAAVMWTACLALQDRGQLREDEMWVPVLVQSQVDALSSEDWLGAKQRHGIQAARRILQDRETIIAVLEGAGIAPSSQGFKPFGTSFDRAVGLGAAAACGLAFLSGLKLKKIQLPSHSMPLLICAAGAIVALGIFGSRASKRQRLKAAASAGNTSQMQARHWHSRRKQAKDAGQQLEAVVSMLQEIYTAASDI